MDLVRNTLQTSGNVEIKFINSKTGNVYNTIVDHNTGTAKLCAIVAEALAGGNIMNKVPGYIVPIVEAGIDPQTDSMTYKNMFSFGIPLDDNLSFATSDDGATTIATFTIESTFLSTGRKIAGFRLLGADYDRTTLAQIIKEIDIESNTNLQITWTLQIKYI